MSPDQSHATYALLMQLRWRQLPMPQQEYVFYPGRRWRFDLAWVVSKLALEIEGGVWTGGRHVSPVGYLRDMEKYNRAVLSGWRVLRATPDMVMDGSALVLIEEALQYG